MLAMDEMLMAFNGVLALLVLIPWLALPWVWLTLPKGFLQPTWRSWVGFGSLAAVTLQTLVFIGIIFASAGIGGFNQEVQFWIVWTSVNRMACFAIKVVALFAKVASDWWFFHRSSVDLLRWSCLRIEVIDDHCEGNAWVDPAPEVT